MESRISTTPTPPSDPTFKKQVQDHDGNDDDDDDHHHHHHHHHPPSFHIWKFIFGFVDMAVVKCAIELKIGDTIETHGAPMTLSQLSSALNCSPPLLRRIMRFLVNRGIFKETKTATSAYAQTPLSRLLITTTGENSMAPLFLLESNPAMLAPWHCLSSFVKGSGIAPFEAAHGEDLWSYAAANPAHSELINEAMACNARVIAVPAILESCPEIFNGIECLVDVGGGNGTSLKSIIKACPWIKGVNFDLPHVVSPLSEQNGLKHVGGDMFHNVPKADAAFLMWVLHDWNDEECIKILKNCREAIGDNRGKVIIVEAVINENENENENQNQNENENENQNEKNEEQQALSEVGFALDMVMMVHTNEGKERTRQEWDYVLHKAGFTKFTITPIPATHSVIQAFP